MAVASSRAQAAPRVGARPRAAAPSRRAAPRSATRAKAAAAGAAAASAAKQATVENVGASGTGVRIDALAVDALPALDDAAADSPGGVTFAEALFNSVNILMGVGLLSVPFALKEGGWAALGVLLALGATTNYTGKLLMRCQEVNVVPLGASKAERREALRVTTPLQTYEDIGEAAFGARGRQFIQWVLYTELVGTCSLFYILEADHLELLFGSPVIAREVFTAVSFLLFTPTLWLSDLSGLAYVGLAGVVSSLGVAGLTTYDFVVGHGAQVAETTAAAHIAALPVTFGMIAFVFAGHAVFPSIYSSMEQPEEYDEVLDLTYVIVGVVSLLIGGCGYAAYGAGSLEEVTLNLPAGPLAAAAASLVLVNPFAKFALTLDPVSKQVEKVLDISNRAGSPTKPLAVATRTSLSMACLVLATSVPSFSYCMSVCGSFLTMTVSLIFPSLCYVKLYDKQLGAPERALNWGIVAVGGAASVFGTWSALQAIADATA